MENQGLLLKTGRNGQEKRKISWRKGVTLAFWKGRGVTGRAGE